MKEIYEKLIEDGDYEDCANKLYEKDILSIVDDIKEDRYYDDLKYVILILQYIYNNCPVNSIISDSDYDIIYEKYNALTNEEIVGAVVKGVDRKTGVHKYPDLRGTISKIYWINKSEDGRRTLLDWMKSLNRRWNIDFVTGIEVTLLPKWDGTSLILECDKDGVCEKALTRGDVTTNKAVDLSYIFKGIRFNSIDNTRPFGLKCELMIDDDNFNKLDREFATKRTAVSGLINTLDIPGTTISSILSAKPLQYQFKNETPQLHPEMLTDIHINTILSFNNLDMIEDMIIKMKDRLLTTSFDFDGIVIRINREDIRNKVGRDGAINNYEIAYKFPPIENKVILKDVVFQYGSMGAISPVAKIEPTIVSNKKIQSISLGSIARFRKMNLCIGDEMILKYEIIPYLDFSKHMGGEKILEPVNCKFCGSVLTESPLLGCYNVDCPSRNEGKIINYLEKMKIPNLSDKRVHQLFKKNILTQIEDLYRLSIHKSSIIELPKFGIKIYNNILESINHRNTVYDYELLGALGIRDVSGKIFKKILSIYYIDELIQICINNQYSKIKMEGVGDITVHKIVNGIIENLNTIKFLCTELNIISFRNELNNKDKNDNVINICFTKIRDKLFEEFLLSNKNVLIHDSYNKNIDILICKDIRDTSSKIKKALKDDKKVISLENAYNIFKYDKSI